MNAKLLLKLLFLMIVLLFLVIMGMHNRSSVAFVLPPLITRPLMQPAAIMYFAFFAIGVLTGSVLAAGLGKKGSSGSSKAPKSGR
jgi:hypothetical protein